jgi:hypothetical protein
MKVIDNEVRYTDYFLRQLRKYLRHPGTYIYGAICVVGLCLYWYKEDFLTMLKIFSLLTTAFSVTFLLSEVFSICTAKQIEKNKLITIIIVTTILLAITNVYFDNKVRYWSIALGVILFIPVLISWTITKIRLRL